MKPRVIILTGASGFIGRHLLERLMADQSLRVVVVGRRHAGALRDQDIFVESDLSVVTAERLAEACGSEVDAVFHLAATTAKRKEEANQEEEMLHGNVQTTWRLLQALPRVTRRFVLTSTVDVYPLPVSGELVTEETPVAPPTIFGAMKVCVEHLVRIEAHRRQFGFTILRLGHIYGPGEEAYGKLIPETIRALKRGDPPTVHGNGSARRDYLYVADAIEATVRAACIKDMALEPINVVSGSSVSIREVVECLCSFANGIQPRYLIDKGNGHSLYFDNRRLRTVLGDWSFVSLQEGLRREWEDFSLEPT